jgi:hydrogenase nickel incorporation protein HypA/HybF
MHELSIAQALMDIVQRHAGGRPVTRVEVRVGHLRQVVPAALEFAFELVARGTVAEGAELVLDAVPAAGRCRACGTVSQMEAFPLACAGCGSWDVEVIRGEELLLDTLELEEPLAMRTGGTGGGD